MAAKPNTPLALTVGIVLMFFLSAVQLFLAQTTQKIQYLPDFGDDAGATCCIGREACEVEEHPPTPSCFYAVDHGALPSWYECVAPICNLWPNTTCWADAAKARHEMGWGGAYLACDYDSSSGVKIANECCAGGACTDTQVLEDFYSCIADSCRLWDGSSGSCEFDADMSVHQRLHDAPVAASQVGPPVSCVATSDKAHYDILETGTYIVRLNNLANDHLLWGNSAVAWSLCADGPGAAKSCWDGLTGKRPGATATLKLTKGGRLTMYPAPAAARFDKFCAATTKATDYVGFESEGVVRAGFRFTRTGP